MFKRLRVQKANLLIAGKRRAVGDYIEAAELAEVSPPTYAAMLEQGLVEEAEEHFGQANTVAGLYQMIEELTVRVTQLESTEGGAHGRSTQRNSRSN